MVYCSAGFSVKNVPETTTKVNMNVKKSAAQVLIPKIKPKLSCTRCLATMALQIYENCIQLEMFRQNQKGQPADGHHEIIDDSQCDVHAVGHENIARISCHNGEGALGNGTTDHDPNRPFLHKLLI